MKTPLRLCLTREGGATLVPPVARGFGHPGSMPVPPGECPSILDEEGGRHTVSLWSFPLYLNLHTRPSANNIVHGRQLS